MKQQTTLSIATALLLGSLSANLVWATPPNFQLTSAGNNIVLDGVYISPYTALVNGVPTTVICDDFTSEVTVGETWRVTTSTVANLASNVTWATDSFVPGYDEQRSYSEAAWLVTQLLAPANQSKMGEISYAIWGVFDPTGVQTWLNNYNDLATYNAVFTGSTSWLSQAEANSSGDFSNVLVYTPVDHSQSCCGRPQEFLAVQTVRTPEVSALATLGFDFTCLAVVLYFFRRRLSAKLN